MIVPHSPAWGSLKKGDKILKVNHLLVSSWEDLNKLILERPAQIILLTVERNKTILKLPIKIEEKRQLFFKKYGWLGIGPSVKWPPHLLKKFNTLPCLLYPREQKKSVILFYLMELFLEK